MLRQKRRNGRLFDRSPAAIAHPGGGQPQRRDAGAKSRRPALPPQHTEAYSDRSGLAFPARGQGSLEELQASIASVATDRGEPAGVLKVSLGLAFGVDYILPLLPEFLKRYPNVCPDWQFESRLVDLIAEGFDAAIGGGIELAPGVVSRTLAPLHIIAVASPAYMKGRTPPADPSGLAALDGIVMRSSHTGRIRERMMRDVAGAEKMAPL